MSNHTCVCVLFLCWRGGGGGFCITVPMGLFSDNPPLDKISIIMYSNVEKFHILSLLLKSLVLPKSPVDMSEGW